MLKDLVKKSRSYRSFKSDMKISREELLDFVDAARLTSAAMNMQTLKYRLVYEKEECASLLAITRWATKLGIELPPKGHAPSAYIVICHDNSVCDFKPIFLYDVGICAQTIMMAAAETGYGGCIIGSAQESEIKATLGLPENICPKLIVAIGVPDEEVVLEDSKNKNTDYYRDENNVHHVPKRLLEEIIIK